MMFEIKGDQTNEIIGRLTFAAFPVLDRALGNAEKIGELLLREAGRSAEGADVTHRNPPRETACSPK